MQIKSGYSFVNGDYVFTTVAKEVEIFKKQKHSWFIENGECIEYAITKYEAVLKSFYSDR